jgi:hypothetical protein
MVENTVEEKKERKRKSASDDASLESKGACHARSSSESQELRRRQCFYPPLPQLL